MQIKITLVADEPIKLPIAYRHAQQSLIYNALRKCPGYSQQLHEHGTSYDSTGFKLFTFSPFKGSYVKVRKRLIFNGRVFFEIRCVDPFMAMLLLEGFSVGSRVEILHNKLVVEACVIENKRICCGDVRIKTNSPITVLSNTSDGHTVYYSPDDIEFYERIVANAERKWCSLYNREDFSLKIKPAEEGFRKLVTLFKGTYVNGWSGSFVLEGNPAVIDFLYNTGLGNKTSQGFGMFEVAD